MLAFFAASADIVAHFSARRRIFWTFNFVVVARRAIDCLADINRCLKVQTFYIVSATIYSQ